MLSAEFRRVGCGSYAILFGDLRSNSCDDDASAYDLQFAGILHEGIVEKEGDDAEWTFSSSVPHRAMEETVTLARSIISAEKQKNVMKLVKFVRLRSECTPREILKWRIRIWP